MARYVTLTACGPSSTEAIEMPDFLIELRHLPRDGAVFTVPAVASKWAAGEIKLKADQACGTISAWTMPSVRFSVPGMSADCLPVDLIDRPATVSAWVNVATGMRTYTVHDYDPSKGWLTKPESFWASSGMRRPLGHGRWVQLELDDSPEINAYAARARRVVGPPGGGRGGAASGGGGGGGACANPACPGASAGVELKKCGACRQATYCSRACQVQHWPVHKRACRK